MTVIKRPSAQQVAVAWLKTLPELAGIGIASTLPDPKQWGGQDFVTADTDMGGAASPFLMARMPGVQVSAWAVAPDSTKPAWNRASVTAEAIGDATYGALSHARLGFPAGFTPVDLQGISLSSTPRRMTNDTAALAHYVMLLRFTYNFAGLTSASTEGI